MHDQMANPLPTELSVELIEIAPLAWPSPQIVPLKTFSHPLRNFLSGFINEVGIKYKLPPKAQTKDSCKFVSVLQYIRARHPGLSKKHIPYSRGEGCAGKELSMRAHFLNTK